MQRRRQLLREQQHGAAARQTDAQEETQRHTEHLPLLVLPPQRMGPGHQTAQRQRQTGRGQDHQQVVDIIGHIEVCHTFLVQQVAQRDLVQRSQHLGHRHRRRQNGGAGHEVLLPVFCHENPFPKQCGACAPLFFLRKTQQKSYFNIASWKARKAERFSSSFSGRWIYSVGNLA